MKNLLLLILMLPLAIMQTAHAQISKPGLPPTLALSIKNEIYPVIEIPAPDVSRLLAEDAFTDKHGIAMRFAVSTPVNINFSKEGAWMQLNDGSRVCRLAIQSQEAQALIMYYKNFVIPEGGTLFMYDKEQKQIIGAFTHFNNRNGGTFATQMVRGGTTIFEYHQPAGLIQEARIIIDEVGYVYRTAEVIFGGKGFGGSDTCEVNIKCPEGNNWQNQALGVARVSVKKGSSSQWCSGSLVNNARQDLTPYFLTADHCGFGASADDYDRWIFYFKYQGDSCKNPSGDLNFNFYSIVGATKVAAAGGIGYESDFKLLLLNERVPEVEYQPYFNGWDASDEASATGFGIHHPQGDIKKISTFTQPLISDTYNGNDPDTYWRVRWAATETNHGVTEPGSSGSPLFDANGLIVGQLTGGSASCTYLTSPDYYGKFSHSWDKIGIADSTQLKAWLDPDNTGVLILNGIVDVPELEKEKRVHLTIFPNPTNGVVWLNFDKNLKNETVQLIVLDLAGRRVLDKTISAEKLKQAEINLSFLKEGIYFVRTIIDKEISTQKIIKTSIR